MAFSNLNIWTAPLSADFRVRPYLVLKRRLDSLRYCEPLGIDSAALVERLLNDLLKTTEGFQQLKKVNDENRKKAKEAEDALLPLQRETQRLTKQNNDLHLELMRVKEATDSTENQWRAAVKRLEGELTDLRFLLETSKQKAKKAEAEAAQSRDRLESLLSKTYVPSAQKGVKDPLLPRGESNLAGRQQSFEASVALEEPTRSGNGGPPGRSKANEEWARELGEADERARRFQEEAEKWEDMKKAADMSIARLQEQVSNRDKEIVRLSELVLTKPNTEQVFQRYRQETSDQTVTKLNERVDFLNNENVKLDEQLQAAQRQLSRVAGMLQENESLLATVTDLKAKNLTLRRRVEDMERTGAELEQGQADLRAAKEAGELKLRNEELRNQVDTLNRELKRAKEDQARSLQVQAAYNSDKKAFLESLEKLNSEKTSLQGQVAEAQSAMSQLQGEVKTSRDAALAAQTRLSNLQRELELNQQSMSRVNKDHLSTAEESITLRQRISTLETQVAMLQNELRDTKFDLERSNKLRAAAEEQLTLIRGDSFKSKTELDSQLATRQRLQVMLEGAQKELQLVKEENQTLSKLREKDKKALLDAERRVQDINGLLQNTQENVRVVQKEHAALSEELAAKLEDIRRQENLRINLERELAELRPLRTKWQEGLQDRQRLQSQLSDKDLDYSQRRKEVEELRDQIKSKDSEIADLRRQLDRARADREEALRQADDHDRRSAAYSETAKKVDYLESDIDILRKNVEIARESERRTVRELEQVKSDLLKSGDKCAILQKALDRMTAQKEDVEAELAQSRASASVLSQKDNDRESEKIRLEEKSFQVLMQCEDLRRQLTQEQKARSELEDDLSRVRRKSDGDQVTLQRLTEQNSQLKSLAESLEKARDDLMQKLKLHQQDRSTEESQRSQLLLEISNLRQDLQRREEELQDLRTSLQSVDKDRDYVHSLLDEKTEQVSTLQMSLTGRTKEAMELKDALTQYQTKDMSQSHRLDEREVEIRRLTDRVGELQRQSEELRALAAQRTRDLQTHQEDIKSITRENQIVNEQLIKMTQDRDRLKSSLEELTKAERVAQQLKRNVEREKEDLLLTYRKACEENERLTQSVQAFKGDQKDQFMRVQSLEQDLQGALDHIRMLEGELEASRQEAITLERQVSTLTLQLQTADRKVQEALDAKESLYADISGVRHFSQTLESNKDDLQRRLAQLENEKLILENKMKHIQNEGSGARSQIDYERKRYQDLERVLAAERDSRLKLQSELEKSDDDRIKLKNEMSRLQIQTSGGDLSRVAEAERALREENGKLKHLLFKSETKVSDFLNTQFEGDCVRLSTPPGLLEVYPQSYSPELAARLGVFALPDGLAVYRKPQPEDITHFVATNNDGANSYCSSCRISEKPSKKKEVYFVKGLVIVSAVPMYTLHRQLLEHFRELVSRNPQYRHHQEHMRFRVDYRELLLSVLFTGLPPASSEEVLVTHYPTQTLVGTRLTEEPFLQYRAQSPLKIPNFHFHVLLQKLRPEHIIDVLHCLLFELRVVLVSSDESILGPVAEALLSLLLPFRWKHVYVPYLPLSLGQYLDAPVPYLMGVRRGTAEVSGDQVIVDLDFSTVEVPQELPSPPAPFATQLYKTLIDITRADSEFRKSEEGWIAAALHTQRAVLNYFLHVLKQYNVFVGPRRSFNDKGFLQIQEKFNREFYETLFKTQLWMQFLEVSSEETAIFHECLERIVKTDYMLFRLDQTKEVDFLLDNYRRPLRIGLESLFNAFRPEETVENKPVSARPDSEQATVSPPSDRLRCGSYWYPLQADLFLDFRATRTDGEIMVKNLDTGEYQPLRND